MRYNKEQRRSIFKWLCGSVFVGAFGFSTAWIMFVFAWLDKSKGINSWFWWWMDDERKTENGWASDYESYIVKKGGNSKSIKESFWIAWNWHTRNSVWNLKRSRFLIKSTPAEFGNNNIDVVSITINDLYTINSNNRKRRAEQGGLWIATPGLKYIPLIEDEDIWQVNQGDYISYKTSILGEGMMWFYPKGKTNLRFRYGHCRIVDYKIFGIRIWKGWRTVKLGFGDKSYVMTIKHQNIKPWQ